MTDRPGGIGGWDRLVTKTTCAVWHHHFDDMSATVYAALLTVTIDKVNRSKRIAVVILMVV